LGEFVMTTTMMLTENEASRALKTAKHLLQESGFQFRNQIPFDGEGFTARHPFSGQVIFASNNTVSARGASDPERLSWVRIEVISKKGDQVAIKPWKLESKDGLGWVEIDDLAQWTKEKLTAYIDVSDRRNFVLRLFHRMSNYKPKETYKKFPLLAY